MHAYEEYKPVMTKKRNTAASVKDRELALQKQSNYVSL